MVADDLEAVLSFLAPDIEFVRFGPTLQGIEALRQEWPRLTESGPDQLDVEFEMGEREDLGDGRISTWSHQVFRWQESGDLAYDRRASVDYLIKDGKIARWALTTVAERYGKA